LEHCDTIGISHGHAGEGTHELETGAVEHQKAIFTRVLIRDDPVSTIGTQA